jgi:hypothetical protein
MTADDKISPHVKGIKNYTWHKYMSTYKSLPCIIFRIACVSVTTEERMYSYYRYVKGINWNK